MRTPHIAAVAALLLLAGTGCGGSTDRATEGDGATSPDVGSVTPPPGELEPITSRGVAAVVRDVLGPEPVAEYIRAAEDDSVGVEVRLAGGRDVLIVMVQTEGEPPPVADCEDLAGTGSSADTCTVVEDGSILISGTGEAFSDGNRRGSTVRAASVHPETGRAVYALHETYATTPTLDLGTLEAIVSDPALAAMTDAATNGSGADIALQRPGG